MIFIFLAILKFHMISFILFLVLDTKLVSYCLVAFDLIYKLHEDTFFLIFPWIEVYSITQMLFINVLCQICSILCFM